MWVFFFMFNAQSISRGLDGLERIKCFHDTEGTSFSNIVKCKDVEKFIFRLDDILQLFVIS